MHKIIALFNLTPTMNANMRSDQMAEIFSKLSHRFRPKSEMLELKVIGKTANRKSR